MNVFQRFKSLPVKTKSLLGLGVIIALVVALPLFIWGIVNLRYDLRERASSGEPGVCVAVNNVINVYPTSSSEGTCHDIQLAVDAVNGDNFSIQVAPGTYNINNTINIQNKNNLHINGTGNSNTDVKLKFNIPSGHGISINNSSGGFYWLEMTGTAGQNLVNVVDGINLSFGSLKIDIGSANAFYMYRSNNTSIYNSDIKSTGRAIFVGLANNFNLLNSKIHDSNEGLRVESAPTSIMGNLFINMNKTALWTDGLDQAHIEHNTFLYNGDNASNTASVEINGSGNGSMFFEKNIIAFGEGPGIFFNSYQAFTKFSLNDLYNAGTSTYPNYVGMADQNGVNGNTSADPAINTNPNYNYCLYSNSPAIYGNVNNYEYMGYIGSCGFASPTPNPTATAAPASTPNPSGEPNYCGGTCGSHSNCQPGYFCNQGYCRNPICPNSTNCNCNTATTKPSVKPLATNEVIYVNSSTKPSGSPKATSTPTASAQAVVGDEGGFKLNDTWKKYGLWGLFALGVILVLSAIGGIFKGNSESEIENITHYSEEKKDETTDTTPPTTPTL